MPAPATHCTWATSRTNLPKHKVHESYIRHAKRAGDRRPLNQLAFGRKLLAIPGVETREKGWTDPIRKRRYDTYVMPEPSVLREKLRELWHV